MRHLFPYDAKQRILFTTAKFEWESHKVSETSRMEPIYLHEASKVKVKTASCAKRAQF
jgi:hypothetical protein